jgi:hypothetical protein
MPRWFVPEVVQSSGMDCGPAALKALLNGVGIRASYGRLREACQTGLDGTSIDVLEEMATAMGLDAGQSMAPSDHLLVADAGLPPVMEEKKTRSRAGRRQFVGWGEAHGVPEPARRLTQLRPLGRPKEVLESQARITSGIYGEKWAISLGAQTTLRI